MELKRKPLQGVLNILSFNRHFYFYGIIALALIIIAIHFFKIPNMIKWIVILSFIYGLIAPLIISAYVYDFSNFYKFKWLNHFTFNAKATIVNINAGFDETSFTLKNHFQDSDLKVFDFYNPKKHTEPAIVRARKVSFNYPNTKSINSNAIPLEKESVDIIFLISSAHEIRDFKEKVNFLKECKRLLKPNGSVILVEHLRDLPNFLAFTIGFTHFFSKKNWINAFTEANFQLNKKVKFTPFMSSFQFK
tara:strand:+ start:1621 stop:2364 length:744 start_codon:yes stop_codon:yes gene_type:complete